MSLLWCDIKTHFRQFPVGLACAYSASRLVTRICDGASATTYSQFGEDRVLPLFLAAKPSGFYVDVGANHPAKGSNTFWLYKHGWRGITVEPNAMLSKLHRKVRPHDIQLQALVSDSDLEMEFVEFENHLYSSASREHVERWGKYNNVVARRKMKPRTLTSLLEEARCPEKFDLLCIDVEGVDLAVLRSLNWSKYQPEMVVAEMSDFIFGSVHPITEYLASNNYFMKAFDGYNGYFQSKDSFSK